MVSQESPHQKPHILHSKDRRSTQGTVSKMANATLANSMLSVDHSYRVDLSRPAQLFAYVQLPSKQTLMFDLAQPPFQLALRSHAHLATLPRKPLGSSSRTILRRSPIRSRSSLTLRSFRTAAFQLHTQRQLWIKPVQLVVMRPEVWRF